MNNKKLRVLFVSSFYAPEVGGGAEMTLQRLASGLHRRGHVIASFTTGETRSCDNVDGVTVHRFPIDNTFRKLRGDLPNKWKRILWQWRDRYSVLMADRLDEVISNFKPDVVQFHNLSGITRSVWRVPKRYRIPTVQVLHDLNLLCPNSSMFARGRSCSQQCYSCLLFRLGFLEDSQSIDAVVGVSQFVIERLLRAGYFSSAQPHVIYNAQSLPDPFPLRLCDHDLRFGYIGALSPPKGLEWLIDQFDSSLGTLNIAGEGAEGYVDALRSRASGKAVKFVGSVKPTDFFRYVDVGVVPSIWNEALGNVAIEAAALGRPVIASSRGGLPEIITNEENGLLVNPDRPDSLGDSMRRLVDDRSMLRRMAAAAPASVQKFTSIDRFLNEYENIYEGLMHA